MPRRPGSLTRLDLDTLEFIRRFTAENQAPPTLAEVAVGMGWTAKTTAQRHVDALVAAGHLTRTDTGTRQLRVARGANASPGGSRGWEVPIVRKLAPGEVPPPPKRIVGSAPPAPFPSASGMFAFLWLHDSMAHVGLPGGSLVYADAELGKLVPGDLVVVTSGKARAGLLFVRSFDGNRGDAVVGRVRGWFRYWRVDP